MCIYIYILIDTEIAQVHNASQRYGSRIVFVSRARPPPLNNKQTNKQNKTKPKTPNPQNNNKTKTPNLQTISKIATAPHYKFSSTLPSSGSHLLRSVSLSIAFRPLTATLQRYYTRCRANRIPARAMLEV